ncbi:hypothetical protein L596_000596 [Steinernema carpocapsae]|uniref:Uncharacterized protein n=1 Tax=Steinernema carpocapsae TaxID=34508 RepID=A0A4U8UKZ3_STECR|nr:hypothetical protein L596_000596 [Steinernema carpocapsae]
MKNLFLSLLVFAVACLALSRAELAAVRREPVVAPVVRLEPVAVPIRGDRMRRYGGWGGWGGGCCGGGGYMPFWGVQSSNSYSASSSVSSSNTYSAFGMGR